MKTRTELYLTCVLCRQEGVITYPEGYECANIDIIGDFTGRFVAATVCHACCHGLTNQRAIEYYADCGIPLRYLASTYANDTANRNYSSDATMISKDGFTADILDVRFLTRTLVDGCTLHSFEYSDGAMLEIPPRYDFFGSLTTPRRSS